jgi:molybdopterin molybdotransferase
MSSKTNADCCADGHDGPALKLSDALSRILAEVQPVAGREMLAVRSALGRVLSTDVVSRINVPSHTNSAMDGYALIGAELSADGETSLSVIGTAAAGRPFGGKVDSGQCVRIMTGAPMPAGADTVVMQENVVREGDAAFIGAGQEPGQHVRQAGEDIAAGNVALSAGTRLMPAEIGILGSLGVSEVSVRRRPRVAFFSTGDELRSVGEPLGEGQIYDSNRYTIFGMLTRLGVEVLDMGVIRDDRDAVEQAFAKAAAEADAIVTCFRRGRGLRCRDAAAHRHRGVLESSNETGAAAGIWPHRRRTVLRSAGQSQLCDGDVLPARAAGAAGSRGHAESRAAAHDAGHIRICAAQEARAKTGHQGSGVLSSMAAANCFIVLPEDSGPVSEGDEVTVQPFAAFV